jgi:hypothetical protein
MPHERLIPSRFKAARALLMAGLSILRPGLLLAEGDAIPARQALASISPTPWPTNTPIPSVRPEELQTAESRINASINDGLRKAANHADVMDNDLAALKERVKALGGSYEGLRLQAEAQATQAAAMSLALEEAQQKLNEGLKRISDVHDQIESKGARMEGLLDLVNTLKRDLNDDSHEIADLKSEFAAMKKRSEVPVEEQDWWGQLSSWRYLPICGVVLGAVAVGLAASHK